MYNYYLITNTSLETKNLTVTADLIKCTGPAITAAELAEDIKGLLKCGFGSDGCLKVLVVDTGDYGCPNWDCEHFCYSDMEAGVDCGYTCPIADQPWNWTGSSEVHFEAFIPEGFHYLESECLVEYSPYCLTDIVDEEHVEGCTAMISEVADYLPDGADDAMLFYFYRG